jgi:hypothetical protein
LRVLVACEFSGRVRDAFARQGHTAVSCDLKSSLTLGLHYLGDVREILESNWDLMIAHPPCTALTVASAVNWGYQDHWEQQQQDLDFVELLWNAPIPRVCLENPPGLISTMFRRPTQYIHPYLFGEPWRKRTGLWLRGLPKLQPTNDLWYQPEKYPILKSWTDVNRREGERSITFQGIADAMAEQWGRDNAS